MADQKITDLVALAAATSDDLLAIVDDVSGTPTTKKITIAALFADIATPVVFNESGADRDFRMEGDTNANLFFLDASSDRIGIGTSTPNTTFNVGLPNNFGSQANFAISNTINSTQVITLALENQSTSASTAGAGIVAGSNDGAAMASGDRLGFMLFAGSSSGSAIRNVVGFTGFASESWVDGSAYGAELRIETTKIGTATRAVGVIITDGGAITVNEQGNDADTRMEGDTDANLLYLDASVDRVGIGVATPASKLSVNGDLALVDGMTAPGTTLGYAKIYVDSADGDLKIKFGDGTVKTIVVDT